MHLIILLLIIKTKIYLIIIENCNYCPFCPQAIHGPSSQAVLEEAKTHFQEQLLRKAAQREADAAMDEEQKR